MVVLTLVTDLQVFVINDTTLPTASNPAPINEQCITDVPAPDINIITDAADNCAAPVVAFVSDVSNNNTCPEIITRTYSVTDACGNSINLTQVITINDDIAPTASNPVSISVECLSDVPAVDISIITDAADNCSIPVVAFVSETSDGNTCPITITRTYSVTDDCNNSILLIHIITVNDTQVPTATSPADISVECSSAVPAPDISVITDAADNCSIPLVIFVSDVSNSSSCPEVITRTYSLIEDCGNETLITQTITIIDTTTPTASVPSPINVQCIEDVPPPDITIISDVTDNCSAPVVSFVSDVSTGTCPQLIIRTYRIEDGCGNTIDILQAINVNDNILPTASNPAPINIDCADGIPVPDISVVTDAADNCSTPTVAFVSDVSNGMCPEIITRTYSVTDECGNSINVTQDIISNDIDAPTVDVTADCDAIPPPPSLTFTDNCSVNLTVVFSQTDTNLDNTVDYVITRIWTVTDNCGNSSTFTQLINVQIINCFIPVCASDCGAPSDTTPPTADIAPDLNVTCESDIPPPDISVITNAMDNCSATVTIAFVDETINLGCFEKIVRTYSVTDKCGNVLLLTRRISVVDNTPPTASNPASIDVSCTDDIPAPDINVVTDEADNCSSPIIVTFVSDVSNNASCNQRVIRTYSVTDGCGNTIYVTQDINVLDMVPPTADTPSDINIACVNDIPIPDTNIITNVTDNCSTTTVSFISDVSDNNICPETITRTYRVSDDCGNITDIIQLIIISDTIDPTASNPTTLNVQCIGDVPDPDNQNCPETITRIYRVTDDCGNFIDVVQNIIIRDNVAPTASVPNPIAVQCIGDIPAVDINVVTDATDNDSTPTVSFISETSNSATCPEVITRIYRVTDNCTINPLVAFVSEISNNDTCQVIITRTYSVTDDCGNSINVNQEIILIDDVSPTASNPSPMTFSCNEAIPDPDINVVIDASDNFSATTVVFIDENSDNQTCPETITRIYRVLDACGNFIDVTQEIIINDVIPPTASNPATININCGDAIPDPDISVVTDALDNCSTPIVAFVSDVSDNQSCSEIITRTYSVTDDCGNTINVTQDIIITDNSAPTLVSSPNAEITLLCQPFPAEDTVTFTDECSAVVTVVFDEEIIVIDSENYDIVRTWTALDDCDNEASFTQTIHMQSTAETFTNELVFCIEDSTVDLAELIGVDSDGTWESDFLYLLEGNTFNPLLTPIGSYDFIYTTTDNDCSRIHLITIDVNDDCVEYPCIKSIYAVNISKLVTPNGDSKNETFDVSYILNEEVDDQSTCDIITTVKMFSRWGNKVFESDEYHNDWKGGSPSTAFGKADKLPAGTYYYVINLINSGLKPIQGYIYLGTDR